MMLYLQMVQSLSDIDHVSDIILSRIGNPI